MQLSRLLGHDFLLPSDIHCDIARLVLDSRQILPHDLFLAIKGTERDGREYIADAIAKGAVAILKESERQHEPITWQESVPIIPFYQLPQQVGKLAAQFYNFPAKQLRIIGVTGTNGKTSCSHFLAQSLQALSIPCGMIGTLGSGFYGQLQETGLTTPDAITLQAYLRHFVNQGAKAVAMEVSSHGIDQGRMNGIPFEIGLFTNLTQDHLDYHGNMATYAAVKQRFLAGATVKQAIINADDAYGENWIHELAQHKSIFSYSIRKPISRVLPIPCVFTHSIQLLSHGIKAYIDSPWGEGEVLLPLIGQFNLSNAVAVFTALCVIGVSFQDAIWQLSQLKPVSGRMQALGGGNKPLVIVDYAHTPDALEKVLQALRDHTKGKLICVFGCGGGRDKAKRSLMARIAEQLADQIWVTNDNPRHEQPEAIAEQIMQGFIAKDQVHMELDRSQAIRNSIQYAKAGDCVLIAGKGAEHYQQIGDENIPFDDVTKVQECLEMLHAAVAK
ncbi:MAG: UDP-N-acetylmuramoyl-L-alanyl-D-glutamate--2,6-diaminopimelate ligase [Gammaproteobacteria bacterium RIFCSPHIGHO2_12_FULL_37_34]|nr:MAG: UDP-N-acetylmuramoyl-L-alanyl-D-glutamate--2,6-diaminopimelate ligase [Gammaproteobacteria bacterium RIFCSPHIGHO2_12_FULL_37_34]